MADIFVSVGGSDSNSGKSRDQAVRTIVNGLSKTKPYDRLVVMKLAVGEAIFGPERSPGGGDTNAGISVPHYVTIFFEENAVLDQQNEVDLGFRPMQGGTDGFKLLHVRVRNCITAISMRGRDFEIGYCDLRNTTAHAISINSYSDGGWIHDNYCENNDTSVNARSGISILDPQEEAGVPLRTEEGGIPGRPGGGWGFIVADNVVVNTGYTGKANADGNCYIMDLGYNPNGVRTGRATNYTKHILWTRNIGIYAGGCGHKIMQSRYNHVYRNTFYGNKRNSFKKTGETDANVWLAEMANYYGAGWNEWRENIAYSSRTMGHTFLAVKTSGMAGENQYFTSEGHVWDRNLFFNSASERISVALGSSPAPVVPTAKAAPGNDGYFVADPQFVGPLTLGPSPALGQGLDLYRARFALGASSPARGVGRDGGDLGAVQTSVTTPVEPLTPLTSPVLTATDRAESGRPYTFTNGTYEGGSGAPTLTHISQFAGPENKWPGLATIEGNSGIFPDVGSAAQDFRIMERANDTLKNPSNVITVYPASVVTTTPPSGAGVPVISGNAALGSVLVASTGTWEGVPAPTYAFQWRRAGAPIAGATESSYAPVADDEGTRLTVTVTATNSAGSASQTSAQTEPVAGSTPDDDLTGLTADVALLKAQLAALVESVAANAARTDGLGAALVDASGALAERVGQLEVTTNSLGSQMADVVAAGNPVMADTVDAINSRLGDVENLTAEFQTRFARFSVTGRLRLYPSA